MGSGLIDALDRELGAAGALAEGVSAFAACASEIGCRVWAVAEMRRSGEGGFVLQILASATAGIDHILSEPDGSPIHRLMTRTWRAKDPLTWRTAPGDRADVIGLGIRQLLGGGEGDHIGVLPMPGADPSRRCIGFVIGQSAPVIAEFHRAVGLLVAFLERQRRQANLPMRIDLSKREIDVLQSCALGCRHEATALDLGLSPHTVRHHLDKARDKLGAASTAHAIALAMRAGLIR